MKITARAKINLTLDVTGVRDDGFHTLRSVMAPISLADELTIEKSDIFSFDCSIPELVNEKNLCVRAAKLFFESADVGSSASIYLEKKVPFPAGLGGGSADAAAVLRGLNELFGNPVERDALFSLAERLGSDVPLCLLDRPALCEGRGELLTPIDGLPTFDAVIAIGEGRLSTPAVYRALDEANLPVRNDTDRLLEAIDNRESFDMTSCCGNAFEPVVDILCPETAILRERLASLGAHTARLSGSGPSVYGIFADESTARNSVASLENEGYTAYCVKVN